MARSSRGFGRPAPRQPGRPGKGRGPFGRGRGRGPAAWSDHSDLVIPVPAEYYAAQSRPSWIGRMARAAVHGYVGWVRQSPDTRGLGTGLAALYPVGHLAHQYAAADALLLGAFAPPAALAAWVATYKRHGSPRYSATLAATAAGVPVWLATAAHTGITNLPTLLAYTAAASATWSAYTWSDVLKHRRALAARQAQWQTIATGTELEGSRLVKTEPTHVGVRFKVDVGTDGPSVSQLLRGNLAEQIARLYGIGVDQVQLSGQSSSARILWITLQLRDPWAQPVLHPVLAPTDTATDAAAALDAGGADAALVPGAFGAGPTAPGKGWRSITDGPFVLGTIPETGQDLVVEVYDEGGAMHVDVFAGTGGGKSTLLSNLVEQADECRDALVMAIDLGKGTIPHLWREVLDAAAGIGEEDKALQILEWAAALVDERSLESGGRNHVPTPTAPAVILILDEMDTLVGTDSAIAREAKPLVNHIHKRGRSGGVVLVRAGQRNVVQHTGSREGQANATTTIVLRLKTTKEMTRTIEEWQTLGLPDMATYAPGVKGVALVVGDGGDWAVGRVRDLSDFDAVRELSQRRGGPIAHLEPHIAQRLPGYTQRHFVAAGGPGGGPGDDPATHQQPSLPDDAGLPPSPDATQPPRPPEPAPPVGSPRGGDGSFGIDPGDDQAVTQAADGLTAEIERHLANMPEPPATPTSLEELLAAKDALGSIGTNSPEANRKLPVPPHIAGPVLHLLRARAADGARRGEIDEVLGTSKTKGTDWIKLLLDHGLIARRGNTKATRYYLPEYAPDDHQQ
ncbi:hypothetical protein [Actinomadura kijaniata]|uniref:hypothetical protein n=1 Tax=Actinomadura kijaniata TaxID=46161 RepID=UPI0012F772F6|nr:hypothetical protein [Actinomadura kijaniata]